MDSETPLRVSLYVPQPIRAIAESKKVKFEIADIGQGPQIKYISANGHRQTFLAQRMFEMYTWNRAGRISNGPITKDNLTTYSQIISADGFTLTWQNASGTKVEIFGVCDHVRGYLKIWPKMTMGSDQTGNTREKIDIFVCPTPATTMADQYIAVPATTGYVLREPTSANPFAQYMSHPGTQAFQDIGGIGQAAVPANGNAGFLYWYSEDKRKGLYIGTDDVVGYPKLFHYKGMATYTKMGMRFYAVDNRRSLDSTYESPHKMILRPMFGEYWDACILHTKIMKALSHPGLSKGVISTRAGMSQIAKELIVFLPSAVSTNYPTVTHSGVVSEIKKLRDLYNLNTEPNGIFISMYGWHEHLIEEYIPDYFPPQINSVPTYEGLRNEAGIRIGFYTIQTYFHPDIAAYANYAIATLAVKDDLDRVTDTILFTPLSAPYASAEQAIVDLSRSAARTACIETSIPLILANGLFQGAEGFYFDTAGGGLLPENQDSTLSAANRGAGTPARVAGKKLFVQECITAMRGVDGDPQSMLHGEESEEFTMQEFDAVSLASFDLARPNLRKQPIVAACFSPFVRFLTYAGFGPTAGANLRHAMAWQHTLNYHFDLPLSYFYNAEGYTPGEANVPIIPVAEPYKTNETNLHTYLRTVFRDAISVDRLAQRGQRLRELPGSYVRLVARNGFTLTLIPDPLDPLGFVPFAVAPAVGSSVKLSREYDSGKLTIIIRMTNWKETSTPPNGGYSNPDNSESFTISMTTQDYPWIQGPHSLYELVDEDGDGNLTERKVFDFVDSFNHQVLMMPRTKRLFVIKNCVEVPQLQII